MSLAETVPMLFVRIVSALFGYTNYVVIGIFVWTIWLDHTQPKRQRIRYGRSILPRLGSIRSFDSEPEFQFVDGLETNLYVYEAILEGDLVTIISIKELDVKIKDLSCLLWYSSQQDSIAFVVNASVRDLHEHHGMKYTAAYVQCALKKRYAYLKGWPLLVGLTGNKSMAFRPKVMLPIQDGGMKSFYQDAASRAHAAEKRVVEFTVCIPPIYGDYSNTAQLVEKLEMSRLLGARRVVLYNNSIAPSVNSVLQMYIGEGKMGLEKLQVVVHPWKLPAVSENGTIRVIQSEKDIHYFGQLAAINHCLHRYRWLSRYIVFTDLDEFIIPRQHDSWSQLIGYRQKRSPNIAAFLFRSTVFAKNLPTPAKGFELKAFEYGSAVFWYTQRDKYIFPALQRSKLIVDPRRVEEIGIHNVWIGSGTTDDVPPTQGMVYHYRMPLRSGPRVLHVSDFTVTNKFGTQLARKLKAAWSKLQARASISKRLSLPIRT
ncbi:upf0392 protein f13g3.3 [Plakobranchus ocellatus]|uniref:Glycosyltransferase family 92 protein n=1 Tax=Plakobranchus ocellatus TaxID=259542 RepID=A0AAV4B7Q0_9GAST|nr:upf0392 protein f13g3.3 [Plakobranchus ocellatus]